MNETDAKAIANASAMALNQPQPYPGLQLIDLSPEMQSRVGEHVLGMLRMNEARTKPIDENIIYLAALERFGIRCPCTHRAEVFVGRTTVSSRCQTCQSVIVEPVATMDPARLEYFRRLDVRAKEPKP